MRACRFAYAMIAVRATEPYWLKHRYCGRIVTSQISGGAKARNGNPLVPTPAETTIVAAPCRYTPQA